MRTLVTLIIAAAVIVLALCAFLFFTQRSQIYFPVPETRQPGAEVVRLENGRATLKLWVVRRPGPKALIYFGGNAEDVGYHLPGYAAAFPEHTLVLVNYRGYGGSTGSPSESAFEADALAVHEHVRLRYSSIDVMGRSIGSGVAVRLASQRPIRRLVLITPFDSLVNVAKAHFRLLPVGLLMLDRYDSAGRASRIEAPVLVVIAAADEIIPRMRSEALVAAFRPGQVRTVVVPDVGHNTLDLSPDYLRAVQCFLDAG